jgi:hypothetical protein
VAQVLKFENRLVRSLREAPETPAPDELQPFHLASPAERTRRVRRVLLAGYATWTKRGHSIIDAVRAGADGPEAEYALRQLRLTLLQLDIGGWETHPMRTRADVRRLFRKTIGRLSPHRGGWVTTRSHRAAR